MLTLSLSSWHLQASFYSVSKFSYFPVSIHRPVQGQTHPHTATEQSFITALEEIQREQRIYDHISPLKMLKH